MLVMKQVKKYLTRSEAEKAANEFLLKTDDYNAFVDEGSANGGINDCFVVVSRGEVIYSVIYH